MINIVPSGLKTLAIAGITGLIPVSTKQIGVRSFQWIIGEIIGRVVGIWKFIGSILHYHDPCHGQIAEGVIAKGRSVFKHNNFIDRHRIISKETSGFANVDNISISIIYGDETDIISRIGFELKIEFSFRIGTLA